MQSSGDYAVLYNILNILVMVIGVMVLIIKLHTHCNYYVCIIAIVLIVIYSMQQLSGANILCSLVVYGLQSSLA